MQGYWNFCSKFLILIKKFLSIMFKRFIGILYRHRFLHTEPVYKIFNLEDLRSKHDSLFLSYIYAKCVYFVVILFLKYWKNFNLLTTANFDTYRTWHTAKGWCNYCKIHLCLIQVNFAAIIVDNIWRALIGAFSSVSSSVNWALISAFRVNGQKYVKRLQTPLVSKPKF